MEILFVIIAGFIGYFVGHSVAVWKLRQLIKDVAKSEGIEINDRGEVSETKDKPAQVHKLEVEEINDVLYLYERETHDFICQGSSITELAKLSKEYKNISLASVVYRNKVFMFVNGFSKEYVG